MRILLDECIPHRLRKEFLTHDVHTVANMGWSGKKNGELLRLMTADNFEILVTVDQNVVHQQSTELSAIAAIVLVARTNRLSDLLPLMPDVLNSLNTIQPGAVIEITA